MSVLTEMPVEEFVRRFKKIMDDNPDSRFAFFIGAGCSVTSGIPGAATLVKRWLPQLHELREGKDGNFKQWLEREYPGYTEENAANFYGRVIKECFHTHDLRQRATEGFTQGKDPAFGYAVLAQIMTHEDYGKQCNTVLTVNFDDLISDALYLYTRQKPLVIYHDSLVSFASITRTRPQVIKLHGDAMLDPHHTEEETKKLCKEIHELLQGFLKEMGIVFLGYGGNDESIADLLEGLEKSHLPLGAYWVNETLPERRFGEWLRARKALWIKHRDFDELMMLIFSEFDLRHPDDKRFKKLIDGYRETFEELEKRIAKKPEGEVTEEVSKALDKAISKAEDWWAIELEARKYIDTDPIKADEIYKKGIERLPESAELLGNYAAFLHDIRKDYDGAEEYYQKALAADPDHAINLGNYANFLCEIRKDYDGAEEYYKKALEADPSYAVHIGNYAAFLYEFRKNYDVAEEYYKKALEADPINAVVLGNYANFLKDIHKDYDVAEEYYKKALEADPRHAIHLGNYAVFLKIFRKDYDRAEVYHKSALEIDPFNDIILGNYANFLKDIRNEYSSAEEYYNRALEANPVNANNLGNYSGFLLSQGRKKEGFELLDRALELADYEPLLLECWFYRYAHDDGEGVRAQSLLKIKEMIESGVRSPGWELSENVKRAIEDGHPEPEFLEALSKVVADELDAKELDKFDVWKNIDLSKK